MQINILKTESKLMGRNMLRIKDWETADEILVGENAILEKYNPAYIYLEVDATDLVSIHKFEAGGYNFSEFRIRCQLITTNLDTTTRSFFPFVSRLIGEEDDFNKAQVILVESRHDDRFSNDPLIGVTFSNDRLKKNLKKSFTTYPKEFLLGVINSNTNELVAFRSGSFMSDVEAHYYQYGIGSGFERAHMASMLEVFTIDFLKQRGIRIINAVSTGYNTIELNRLLMNGFKINQSTLLMRKVF
jgi:hypothetical protein